ncbi:MAG: DUF4832 domain-containing protein [Bacteroidales bacterium]|nr:DUF4832 domain-containing protein [Bacteroidales bacterium]
MKKNILFLLITCFWISLTAQNFTPHTYMYSDSVYVNPERGFYRYTERSGTGDVLNVSSLKNFRDQGYSLIYRIFYLRDFVNAPISQAYLDKIKDDFAKIRSAGVKAIVRFAYTSSMNAPYGDAAPERVNEHIQQLAPLLRDNSDVILVLQAGFIGAWGEWYYTDYFATGSPDNVTPDDLQERKTLVNNLLAAMPEDRMVQLRYVGYKIQLFDSIPVNAEEAYSGSPKSRISHHNDCFVSSVNDVGSYRYIVSEKDYLERDSKYTSVGGETCRWYESRSNCDTSLYEMARFHWTYINQDYFGTTISQWQADGCYPEMQKKLGYRYSLLNSSIQDSVKPGGAFTLSFKLKNAGFSNPMNYRAVEIVLQNIASGEKFFAPVNIDLRKYELNSEIVVNEQIGIPEFMPHGAYKVFLNLPDPKFTIKNNPLYSVRLANSNVWDASLGMNSFQHVLNINPNYSVNEPFLGTNFFLPFAGIPSGSIRVDGDPSDWKALAIAGSNSNNVFLKEVKAVRLNDTLFFMLRGVGLLPNTQIFIDADYHIGTGMDYWSWADDGGVDYMVQNNELFKYTGTNGSSDWAWTLVTGTFLRSANDSVVELALPESVFDATMMHDTLRFGVANVSSDWSTISELVPASGSSLLVCARASLNAPKLYVSSYTTNNIVSYAFAEKDSNAVIVVERGSEAIGEFQTLAINSNSMGNIYVRDTDLAANSVYYYRAYLMDKGSYSAYSQVKQGATTLGVFKYPEIVLDGGLDDWSPIPPTVAVTHKFNDVFLCVYSSTEYLYLCLSGDSISDFTIFLNTDGNALTGEVGNNWGSGGFEFKITGSEVFKYSGGAYSKVTSGASVSEGLNGIELQIPLEALEINNNNQKLYVAAQVGRNEELLLLPYKGRNPVLYERVLPADMPLNFTVRRSASDPAGKLIVSWEKCTNCDGFEVVRTEKATGTKVTFDLRSTDYQLIDVGLKPGTSYEYAINSFNFAGKSAMAGPVEISTTLTGIEKENNVVSVSVWPSPATDAISVQFPESFAGRARMNILAVNGELVYTRSIDVENAERVVVLLLSDLGLAEGIYFLRIDLKDTVVSKKFIIRK